MSDQRRMIDVLLERVSEPALRDQLRRAVDELTQQQPLGLVFEDHMPEAVKLPKSPVRRGVTVQYVDGRDDTIWEVRRVRQGVAFLSRLLPDGTIEKRDDVPVGELIVARRLGDPVYPGLTPLATIERGGDKPHHLVIEGENFHALQTLQYTHAGKVDLIYIDPPYNTGAGDWIYNDRYIGEKDSFRHSKWLSFMHRRLTLAKQLLAPTGTIFVSIDHNEHHRLRMLMDQVFGEKNFVSSVSRRAGTGGRQHTYVKQTLDYVLIYRASEQTPAFSAPRDTRYLANFKEQDEIGPFRTEPLYKATLQSTGRKMRYWIKCPDGTFAIPPGRSFPTEVVEGQAVASTGEDDKIWRWSPETFTSKRDLIVFKRTKTSPLLTPEGGRSEWNVYVKQYLDTSGAGAAPLDYWDDVPNTLGTKHLIKIGVDFPYPKPVELVQRIVQMASRKDAVILDFFAGTGTTAEAVMRLNAEDGGRRQSIIVTNNELAVKTATNLRKEGVEPGSPEWEAEGVFQKVTRPRIETVVTGVRRDGSTYSEGLEENVSFLQLEYLDRDDVEAGAGFRQVAELLWAKAGAVGPVIAEREGEFQITGHYAVCFDADRFAGFVEAVNQTPSVKMAFIVAPSEVTYGTVKRALRDDVETVHLYENYLTNFEINTGAGR